MSFLKLRKRFARRTAIYAVAVLIFFWLIGGSILRYFNISLEVVKIAGGILIVFQAGWQTLNSEPKLALHPCGMQRQFGF